MRRFINSSVIAAMCGACFYIFLFAGGLDLSRNHCTVFGGPIGAALCFAASLPHNKEVLAFALMIVEFFLIYVSYGWLSAKAAKWTGKDLPSDTGGPDSAGARKMAAMREVEMWRLDQLDKDY